MSAKDTADATATAAPAAKPVDAVTFVDQKFKSRTIVLADDRAFLVEEGRITASDPALIAYLDRHPDFKRVSVGGE